MDAGVRTKEEGRWLPKPNNIITVDTNSVEFFKNWCVFLRPFVNLTDTEIAVVASFLHQRFELSKTIQDPESLDIILGSDEFRCRVVEESGVSKQHLFVIMSKLRKSNVFIGNTLNSRLIPNIRQSDNGTFQLLILFKDTNA